MNKKNIIFICILFTVILFILLSPLVSFCILDRGLQNGMYLAKKPESKIDADVSQIYLVKAIHNQYANTNTYNVYDDYSSLKEANQDVEIDIKYVIEQFETLNEMLSILDVVIATEKLEKLDLQSFLVTQIGTGSVYRSIVDTDSETITFDFEKQTKKIIGFKIESESNISMNYEPGKQEEILNKYMEYLEFQLIDDWQFTRNRAVSQKADLRIAFTAIRTNSGKNKITFEIGPNSLY